MMAACGCGGCAEGKLTPTCRASLQSSGSYMIPDAPLLPRWDDEAAESGLGHCTRSLCTLQGFAVPQPLLLSVDAVQPLNRLQWPLLWKALRSTKALYHYISECCL